MFDGRLFTVRKILKDFLKKIQCFWNSQKFSFSFIRASKSKKWKHRGGLHFKKLKKSLHRFHHSQLVNSYCR